MTAVVLVHGVGLDRQMWRPFTQALAAIAPGRQVESYDLIGHGCGPHPAGPYTLAAYSEQLAAVAAGNDRVDIVGFSMGALVAQQFALDRANSVRRLVLLSGVFNRTAAQRAAIESRVGVVRTGGYIASIEPALARWFTSAFAANHPDVVDGVRARLHANDVESYAAAYHLFATADQELAPVVHRIAAGALVVTGECDERSTPEMAARLAGELGRGRSVVMPGLRHLIPLEAPDDLAVLVSRFLDEPEDAYV